MLTFAALLALIVELHHPALALLNVIAFDNELAAKTAMFEELLTIHLHALDDQILHWAAQGIQPLQVAPK